MQNSLKGHDDAFAHAIIRSCYKHAQQHGHKPESEIIAWGAPTYITFK